MPFVTQAAIERLSVSAAPNFPKTVNPTQHQREVLDRILAFVSDVSTEAPVSMRVEGPAGSGKSALISFLVRELKSGDLSWWDWEEDRIILAAPTHKACREADLKLRSFGVRDLFFETTSRLLNLREQIDHKTGKQTFRQTELAEFGGATRLIIVDENSMVNDYQIECLDKAVHDLNRAREWDGFEPAKVLLVGDPEQLTPVKERLNATFRDEDFPVSRLTEIVRHSGPILEQSIRIRNHPVGVPIINSVGDGSDVWSSASTRRWEVKFLDHIKAAHNAGKPLGSVMAIAYSRRRVAELCEMARKAVFGVNPPAFVPGELLISTDAVKKPGSKEIVAFSTTNLVLHYADYKRVWPRFLAENGFPASDVECIPVYELIGFLPEQKEDGSLAEHGRPFEINVVHEDGREAFNRMLGKIKALIEQTVDRQEKRRMWRELFYPLKSFDAPVLSAMAITIHRSQGSTIPEVFVDLDDIRRCNRTSDALKRAGYTAVTRASNFLAVHDSRTKKELA